MKSFDDLRTTPESEPEVLNERFLRKVSGVALFTTAKRRGDKSVQHFKDAQSALNTNAGASLEDQVKGLSFAVSDLSKGLIEQRHQIGAVAALSATSLFVNERKSKQKNR